MNNTHLALLIILLILIFILVGIIIATIIQVKIDSYTVGKISNFSDMKEMLTQVGFEPTISQLLHIIIIKGS